MYLYGTSLKDKVMRDSICFFNKIKLAYNIDCYFSYRDYKIFIDDLFEIYKYNREIYIYREEIKEALVYAAAHALGMKTKTFNLEDIRNSIWHIKTTEKNNKIVNLNVYKVKKLQERIL